MNIRTAERAEVEKFQLYNEDNAGNEFIVVESGDDIVGFAQYDSGYDDCIVYFMESEAQGAGRAMIEYFQGEFVEVVANDAIDTAQGFYLHFGFEQTGPKGFDGRMNMTWWAE